MTVSYMDRLTLSALGPSVKAALDINNTEFGWLGLAFNFAYLIATPLAGWWIDRVGARRGLLISVFVWSLVAALHCVAPGFGVLFMLRIALGIAEGPSFTGAAQVVQRILPPDERSRGFGVLFTGSSIGGILVPIIASALFAWHGWRFALFGTAAVGLVWIPLWLVVTRSREVRTALDTAVAKDTSEPRARFAELVRHPIMLRAFAAVFAAAPIFGFAHGWGANYLNSTFGVLQEDVGDYLWLPPLAFDAGALLIGDLAARQIRPVGAPPRMLFAIGILPAMCLGLLPLAQSPWIATAFVSVAMAGAAMMYTLVTADLLTRMPPPSVAFASGIMAGAQSIALMVMSPLVGASVDASGSYDVASLTLGIWVLPGSLIWVIWRPPVKFERTPSVVREKS